MYIMITLLLDGVSWTRGNQQKKKKIETIHPGEKYEINANNLIHFSVKQEKYMALFYD